MPVDPASVPVTLVRQGDQLDGLAAALALAERVAIDTEVPIDGPRKGLLRVVSIAIRTAGGDERSFVVDARDLDPRRLAPLLDGVEADAWNATFDARVLDLAVWGSSDVTHGLRWWDAQLADALLHQGRSGFTWFHGLAWATSHYLGFEAQGKGTVQLSYTATDDLTADQVRYAADDAVETLWVADRIRRDIEAAKLETVCALEMAARPFLDQMERSGLPFDWGAWRVDLDVMAAEHRHLTGVLAELTGGGQGTLFDQVVEPTWNPASDKQVRGALNEWATAEVKRYTSSLDGSARLLGDDDSVTAAVLRDIGGDLCDALLGHRSLAKVLGTYGESIAEHVDDDGRMRPQYLQVVGTNTGRLASRNPNAQNFTPRMLPHVRPPTPDRVFVYADLSQAELRFLAHVADDEALRHAFARDEDVHETTAATMFGFDADELRIDNPERLKRLRQMAKALNFGIAYGTGARALAKSLTANGTPTSFDEGRLLLDQYRQTYRGTTSWADARIGEIDQIARRTTRIDWVPTMRLARSFASIAGVRRAFRRDQHRWPTPAEVLQGLAGAQVGGTQPTIEHVAWVMQFPAPVALINDDEPFTFSSRTVAGRRQQFNLHLDRLLLHAACDAARSPDPALLDVRHRFEREHDVSLHQRGRPLSEPALHRAFEDRAHRRLYIELIAAVAGETTAHALLYRAARARVEAMVNAWRNAPIQGGVADIMLDGYARLHERLKAFPSARPVQTVHDSVVVECDRSDARAVADAVDQALREASLRFCPSVKPKVDVDIRHSLADRDVIDKHLLTG